MFKFIKIELVHEKLLKKWLTQPHFREWWGDPEEEWRLIADALDTGEADMYLVARDDEWVGYVQSWPVGMARGKVEASEEIWLQTLSDETLGVDISLADGALLGQGLGREILGEFIAKMREEGAKEIIIDPDIRNRRAIACYKAAGFQRIGQYPESEGGTLLMRHVG